MTAPAPVAAQPAPTPPPAPGLILSCSLCWAGTGDIVDPASGAVVCIPCMAALDRTRSLPARAPA